MPEFAEKNKQFRSDRQRNKHSNRQYYLNNTASSISNDVFNKKHSLSVDRTGRVDISSSHPDYKYWTEAEDEE